MTAYGAFSMKKDCFHRLRKASKPQKVHPFSVPLLVLLNWYWSFIRVVLEFQLTETVVTLMWY